MRLHSFNLAMVGRGLVVLGIGAAVFFAAALSAPLTFGGLVAANSSQVGDVVASGLKAKVLYDVNRQAKADRLPTQTQANFYRGPYLSPFCLGNTYGCRIL